jgi:hypothetical protein
VGQGGSGWSFLKVLGVIVGLLGMVGFGLCSLCGFVVGGRDSGILLLALLGAGMAALCLWMVIAIFHKAAEDRDRDQ